MIFWYASLRPRARRHNGREHRVVPQLKKGETVCHFAVGVVQFQTQLADVLFSVLLCWLWTLWHCTWKRAYRGCRGMIWLGISESIRADSSGVCWLGHGPNPVKRDKAAAEWWLLGHRGSTLVRPSGSSKSGAGLGGLDTCCWEQSWCHWPTDVVAGAHLRDGAEGWCEQAEVKLQGLFTRWQWGEVDVGATAVETAFVSKFWEAWKPGN